MATRDSGEERSTRVVTWLVAAGTLLGTSLLAFRRKPVLDPFGEETGRGNPSTPPSSKAKALGFEPHDMSARDVSWVLFALGASAAAAIGLMFLMLSLLHASDATKLARFTAEQRARIDPPAPHLQDHPVADLRQERARQEGVLNAYAWIGTDHARARIPVDRAMALAVGRSLDAGPQPAAGAAKGQP